VCRRQLHHRPSAVGLEHAGTTPHRQDAAPVSLSLALC
jgi:hypothetical protein